MDNENVMVVENLMILKQLPVIEERLAALADEIDAKIEAVLSLAVTEETVKDVKKALADLNKDYEALENRRKCIKKEVIAPYEQFKIIYDQITGKYPEAKKILNARIDEIENIRKQEMRDELLEYFDELRQNLRIDFVTMDTWKPNITLTGSMKALKEQANKYLNQIAGDLSVIETMENSDEVLVEFRKSLNLSAAVAAVNNRKAAVEAQKAARKRAAAERQARAEAAAKVEAALPVQETLAPPKTEHKTFEQPETEEVTAKDPHERLRVQFEIENERQIIRKLGEFLEAEGISYQIIDMEVL